MFRQQIYYGVIPAKTGIQETNELDYPVELCNDKDKGGDNVTFSVIPASNL